MSETKTVVLVHPRGRQAGVTALPALAEALRQAGARVIECRLPADMDKLLDALQADALPVVLK